MPRYIDANKLLSALGEEPMVWTDSEYEIQARFDHREFKSLIQDAPTADVVEVVRCSKCKYYNSNQYNCFVMRAKVRPTDFCSHGERKESND